MRLITNTVPLNIVVSSKIKFTTSTKIPISINTHRLLNAIVFDLLIKQIRSDIAYFLLLVVKYTIKIRIPH